MDNFKILQVDYSPFSFDMKPADEHNKQELLYALNIYLKTKHIDIDVALLENLSMRKLIATLASILPFEAGEKQALLECGDVSDCIQTLKTILKMDTVIGNDEKRGLKC
jgi:Lon protease-like protein